MSTGFVIFPTSWKSAASGIIGFFLSPLTSAIHYIFEAMGDDIRGTAHVVMEWVDERINEVLYGLPVVGDIVGYIINAVINFVTQRIPDLVGSFVSNAVDFGLGIVRGIAERAFDLASGAMDLATSAAASVADTIGSIGGLIEDGISRVEGFAHDLIDRAIGDLTQWVKDAYHGIVDNLGPWIVDIVNRLFPFLGDLASLWRDIFGWLVWLARLPFESIHDFEHALAGRLRWSNVKGGFGDVADHMDEIESAIAHVIG